MEQKKRNGHARHGKRLLGLLMALAMLGVLFMPVYAANDAESTEQAETTATATYNFYVNDEVYNTQTLTDGEELQKPADPAPAQENTTFAGWFTAVDEMGEEFTAFGPVAVEEDKTVNLYAHWTTEQPAPEQPADEQPTDDHPTEDKPTDETPTDEETPTTTPEPTNTPDTLENPDDAANEPVVQATLDLSGAKVEIEDNIASNGTDAGHYNIKVTKNGRDITSQVLTDENCTITWTMDDGNGNSKTLIREEFMDNKWTMAADGSWVDVAYNKGAHKTFTVAITDNEGNTINASLQNNYNDQIENGSFETPAQNKNGDSYQPYIDSGTQGIVWQTTSKDKKIELISTRDNVHVNKNGWGDTHKDMAGKFHNMNQTPVKGGDQYAELNANYAGALYQDVMTAPGTTMNWSVWHNGRNGTDTMAVVIMSKDDAEKALAKVTDKDGLIDHDQLLALINTIKNDSTAYPGAQVATDLEGYVGRWTEHKGTYKVPDGQYLTRYFFVAIKTYNENNTIDGERSVGNHIDKVWFSVDKPPLTEYDTRVTVTKNIYGLDIDTVKKEFGSKSFMTCDGESFVFENWKTVKDENGNDYVTASWTSPTKTATGSSGKEQSFAITENVQAAAVEGKNLRVDPESATTTVNVTGGSEKTVTFNNYYTSSTATLKIKKVVTGPLGDKTKQFKFTYSYNGETSTFDLANNGEYELTVPVGTKVTIAEDDYSAFDYATSYSVDNEDFVSGRTYEMQIGANGNEIVFKNHKDVKPDTGVLLDSMPYVIILIVVAAGIVGGVVLKKRKHGEDDV